MQPKNKKMTVQEFYTQIGGDYADALKRMMNDKLIKRMMTFFINDKSVQQLHEAIEENDQHKAFQAAHTMKGVAGNMSFAALYKSAVDLTEQLRDGTQMPDPVLLAAFERDYHTVKDIINEID